MEGERMEVENQKQNINVEVHVKSHSTAKLSEVRTHVLALLNRHSMIYGNYRWTEFDEDFLRKHVESVSISDLEDMVTQPLDLKSCSVSVHIFTLNEDGPSTLSLEEDEELSAANHWLLPAAEFHGIWESLVYESGVKTQLLDYVTTTIYFSDKNVDSTLISWNRVVLLHGPPGTGKTSLCKALAQKLSIRLSSRYSYGQFVEINSHSLFSKWFSESGKLVTKMFQKIQQLIDDKDALVFVLIDEVESLTASRNASQAGTEPSDAIRVVNSVLTQLDQIKRHSNVVILTTSNVTEKIDLAFVDRADIKQYIGPPSEKGIYNIYLSCLEELMKKKQRFEWKSTQEVTISGPCTVCEEKLAPEVPCVRSARLDARSSLCAARSASVFTCTEVRCGGTDTLGASVSPTDRVTHSPRFLLLRHNRCSNGEAT
ncbi:hypothetical protein F2P81_001868 [Scophthalmus maximus]|uniref:Pachytene checkpoint protein 2 homolog n=1 Tax=Scophthalmus maximus TaxID=52904 RepID=A0A6A4TKJ5_SCOMX|nr:hypothetical protein F2P81_001868 [Scophthalmus maximus]